MKKKIPFIVCAALAMCVSFGLAACGGNGEEKEPDPAPKIERTLLMGDSLFDLWKPDYKTDLAGLPNLDNIAVGGTHSAYWKSGYRLIQKAQPTTLIISIGTNNIADLHQTGREAAEGENGIQAMLEKLHEVVPDCHMYLLTINICGENIRWNAREEIKTCNRLMRAYCAEKAWAETIETEYMFYDDENHEEKPPAKYFVSDYLHYSRAGYVRLTEVMRRALGLPAANT